MRQDTAARLESEREEVLCGDGRFDGIDRRLGGLVSIDRTFASKRSPRGHIEHYQAPSTKSDAADYLNDALRADGWR